jgi:hypothetical protein
MGSQPVNMGHGPGRWLRGLADFGSQAVNTFPHSPGLRLALVIAMTAAGASLASAQTFPAPPVAPPTLPVPPTARPIPAARWTPAQIRESFDLADINSDGLLTRAEAQRLAIMPHTFEDMDENKDGLVDRAEYERSLSR